MSCLYDTIPQVNSAGRLKLVKLQSRLKKKKEHEAEYKLAKSWNTLFNTNNIFYTAKFSMKWRRCNVQNYIYTGGEFTLYSRDCMWCKGSNQGQNMHFNFRVSLWPIKIIYNDLYLDYF